MKRFLSLLIIVCAVVLTYGQGANLTVQPLNSTHIDTILKYHLAGEGVELTNGKFNGTAGIVSSAQIGSFNRNGYVAFPFETGLVMTTGNCSVAAGPNNSTSSSSSTGVSTYKDLQIQNAGLATSSMGNCASLDFDFVAYADTFAFGYIFGSEEYPNYVCANYNDVFAFFLTGPDPLTGLSSTKNIAVIPGSVTATNPSGLPVSINTINGGATGGGSGCYNGTYSQYYIANGSNAGVQYNGMTVDLYAQGNILACETYHMHLGICNIGDNMYDSGVFLKENSFESSLTTKFMMRKEWCLHEDIIFSYATGFADTIFIITPSGDTLRNQPFKIPEATPADSGYYYLYAHSALPCVDLWSHDSIRIKVVDTYKPNLGPDQTLCSGQSTIIEADYNGDDISYYWSTGDETKAIEVISTGEYILDISVYNPETNTRCSSSDTIKVQFLDMPPIDFEADVQSGCTPLTVHLTNKTNSDADFQSAWTFFDANSNIINYSSEKNPTVVLEKSGFVTVKLVITTADGCKDSIIRWNYLSAALQPTIEFTADPEISMISESNGEINFTSFMPDEIAAMPNNNLIWTFGDGDETLNEYNPTHTYSTWGDYLVTLSLVSGEGCADSVSHVIVIEDDLIFPNVITPNGDGVNDVWAIGNLNTDINEEDPDKYRTNELRISDRYGKVVYHAKNYDTYSKSGQVFLGDKYFGGDGLADGVYYFSFIYKGKAKTTKYHGSITIIRQ